jgi:hypothetical protein
MEATKGEIVSANPNLAATSYSSPDNPVTGATVAALMAQGWTAPLFSKINPAFTTPNGGTLVASIVNSDNQSNAQLVRANAQQNMRTVTYFNLPNDVTAGDAIVFPQGSVMILEADNGPSAYTAPVAPPVTVTMAAVFGLARPLLTYSDGFARRSWTAFAGTTYAPGQVFQNNGTNVSVENPTGPQPTLGTFYEVINVYMGQAIVEIGDTAGDSAVLPANG